MNDRLPTHLIAGALVRRVNDAGGFAVVRARGDAQAGALLVIAVDRGTAQVLERGLGATGEVGLMVTGPGATSGESIDDYWQRRRLRDPDLWVIEVDVAGAERFAAETILPN